MMTGDKRRRACGFHCSHFAKAVNLLHVKVLLLVVFSSLNQSIDCFCLSHGLLTLLSGTQQHHTTQYRTESKHIHSVLRYSPIRKLFIINTSSNRRKQDPRNVQHWNHVHRIKHLQRLVQPHQAVHSRRNKRQQYEVGFWSVQRIDVFWDWRHQLRQQHRQRFGECHRVRAPDSCAQRVQQCQRVLLLIGCGTQAEDFQRRMARLSHFSFDVVVHNPSQTRQCARCYQVTHVWSASIQCSEFLWPIVFILVLAKEHQQGRAEQNGKDSDVGERIDAFVENELGKEHLRDKLDG
mmetsp:Transcript_11866/g.21464  ORF Transcript_11866/g.21464 Transcript_11866/m.21464 type:complete len:293 (+) Transcript_11866:1877-2755(+)